MVTLTDVEWRKLRRAGIVAAVLTVQVGSVGWKVVTGSWHPWVDSRAPIVQQWAVFSEGIETLEYLEVELVGSDGGVTTLKPVPAGWRTFGSSASQGWHVMAARISHAMDFETLAGELVRAHNDAVEVRFFAVRGAPDSLHRQEVARVAYAP